MSLISFKSNGTCLTIAVHGRHSWTLKPHYLSIVMVGFTNMTAGGL